ELIEGLIDRVTAEYGAAMQVVATGGIVSLFEGATDKIHHFDRDLTIRGLHELYLRHKRAGSMPVLGEQSD
ncbi:MAG: hypothetical protein AAGL49_01120, partial [Pseudomonadota bacterium]